MKDFIIKELERAFDENKRKELTVDDIKKWIRKTKIKQLAFIFFESVILLGFGLGNLLNNPVMSFSFALGILCLVVWPFLAINIHRYLKKLEYKDEELESIVEAFKTNNNNEK